MKRVVCFSLWLLGLGGMVSARAELFRPETVRGALIGGLAGAVIGHNDGRHGWEGAGYGMAAGAVIGSIVGDARDHPHRPPVPHRFERHRSRHDHPRWSIGLGYYHGHYPYRGYYPYRSRYLHRHIDPFPSPWGWRHERWPDRGHRHVVYRSGKYSDFGPSWRARGAFWGGLAGAVIGHNHGRRGWEGAGYGVAGGYLIGSLLEHRARQRADERAAGGWAAPVPAAPAPVAAAPVTIINNFYSNSAASPMAAANRAFGR